MPTAEELFSTGEPHIVIGSDRKITVPDSLKRIAVQFDHNIETVTFDCPRYWDDVDISTMKIYINYMRPDGKPGKYAAINVVVDDADDTLMHFDWTISRNVSEVKGNLSFLVCSKNVDDEGNEVNHWNSELNRDLTVSEGLECEPTLLEEYPDIITQILTRLDSIGNAPSIEPIVDRNYDPNSLNAQSGEAVRQAIEEALAGFTGGGNTGTVVTIDYDKTVKAVAHRGYSTIAPENTIPAYQLAKQMGFNYAECDIAFTSDNVAVLLHDSTIDRTSDGSGNVTALTYEQLLQYDFGSWKNEKYAGVKIPTFEEFIKLCKNIGLHSYIELKDGGNYTQAQIESIVDMVEKCGMQGNVTYISFNINFLNYVKAYDEKARLGYLADVTTSTITTANNLKTEENEVYMGVYYEYVTDEKVQMCVDNNLPLEIWTVNDQTTIENMNSYITGVTSDNLIAGKILYDKYINYVPEYDNGDNGSSDDTEIEWIAVEYTENSGYYNYEGDFVSSTTVANTGLIGVGEATKIKFTASVANQHNVVFFDADKKYISCTALTDSGTHITDIPANASFFSVAYYIEERDTVNICANGNTELNNDGNDDDIDDGYTVVKTLGSDDIMFGYGITNQAPNYYTEQPKRALYGKFDIPVEYGYTYKFKAISNIPTAQMGCRFYSESVLNTVQGGVNNITYGDYFDPGWQELTTEIEIPEFINNSPTACVRLSFRMDATDSVNVVDGFIQSVTISRKPKTDIQDYTLVKTLGADDIMYRTGNSSLSPNYYGRDPRRAGYYNFDIPIEYGYIYKFDAVSTISTMQMGTQFYNGVVLNAVENNTNFEGTNIYDPGWQNLETKIEVPQYINNSPIAGVRLTFRLDTNNTEISDGIANSKPIQSVTISRKPVQV